jgi:N-acetylglucosamine kinase-like BadF-type ATPase
VNESPSTDLVVGVDGGGTKTTALLADLSGCVVARAQGSGSNQNVVGTESAASAIAGAIGECCRIAGVPAARISGAAFGLAGAGSPEERAALAEQVRRLVGREGLSILVDTDARIALEGAFDGGPGIVAIAGTGSSVMAKDAEGRVRLFGGWGRLLGDEGSGMDIGRQLVRRLLLACDARREFSPLEESAAIETGLRTRDQILTAVYRENLPLSTLAPIVLRAADASDTEALAMLEASAGDLAGHVAEAAGQEGLPEDPGVVLIGGLVDAGRLYQRILESAIRIRVPRARLHAALHPPAEGAVRMACTLVGRSSP